MRSVTITLTILGHVGLATASTLPRGVDCLIHPNMTVDISSPVSGVVESINVDRSDTVKQDDVLAELTSDVEKERYNAALARARFDGDLESSKVSLALNEKEYQRAKKLYADRAIPLVDRERAEANLELATRSHDGRTIDQALQVLRREIDRLLALSPEVEA